MLLRSEFSLLLSAMKDSTIIPLRGSRPPVINLLFVAAIAAAIVAMGWKRRQKSVAQEEALGRAGASLENAIYIRSYDEMDDHLRGRFCHCGGFQELRGEGSREEGGHRYRTARLLCHECEEYSVVYFDTTDLLQ